MTPTGERGFGDVESARAAAKARPGVTTYVLLRNNPRPFMPAEFAWIAPLEFYISRAMPAAQAGISVVEMVQG